MQGILIFGFLAIIAAASPDNVSYEDVVHEQWQNFKLEHGKFYQTEDEEEYRKGIFMENLHKITEHNTQHAMGLISYKMALNHFGDLTADEFLRYYTMQIPDAFNSTESSEENNLPDDLMDMDIDNLPGQIDWRQRGAVTSVKNQGQCGSCWSFSATGALEAQWFKKTGHLISLSEQNLVDCSWKYGNHGCSGGWMKSAYNYIRDNGGIDTEQSYPYQARNGYCHYNRGSVGATIKNSVQFSGEWAMLRIISSVGPLAVAVEVGHTFQFYHSGVYDEPQCGRNLNHAMLVVGYGNESGRDYWLVKNSWGTGWGDLGYIKMSRNRNNQCGIANAPTYPIV